MKLVRFLMKLSNETVTVELKNGSDAHGTVAGVDVNMNILMKNLKLKMPGGAPKRLESMTVRGSSVRCVILPDSLNLDTLLIDDGPKQRPPKPAGGAGRGRGRGRGRGGRGRGGGRGRR